MPCWYFERKEIKNSPSHKDGIDSNTENRYRREGARFILDAGNRMGLRYDTCATGVVYFHRFYMFHSFKEFYRYVTAACCLFLAGKVEETPKKCKDIIKTAQSLLSSSSFQRFGEDPREEVMTMERILLKTIKFDLQVEHPYGVLIKYLKHFKVEKEKTHKMAQMAWTFINDSLCTTLSLQWEPEIIAVSLMYLASRLTRFDPTEWSGRTSSKTKWWEDFVEGMSMELMEDICHQVLDLYSKQAFKKGLEADSPPQSPAKPSRNQESPPPPPPPDKAYPGKKSREVTPSEPEREVKVMKKEKDAPSSSSKLSSSSAITSTTVGAPIPVAQHITPSKSGHSGNYGAREQQQTTDFNSYNPYVSAQMYSASFLSQEGSQNIQSILAGSSAPPPTSVPPHHGPPSSIPEPPQYAPPPQIGGEPPYSYHPPSQPPYMPPSSIPPNHAYLPPVSTTHPPYDPYGLPPNPDPYAVPPNAGGYPPHSTYPPPVTQSTQLSPYPPPSQPPQHQHYNYPPYPPSSQASGIPAIPPPVRPPMHGGSYPPPSSSYTPPPPRQGLAQPSNYGPQQHRGNFHKQGKHRQGRKDIPSLTEIKIAGRQEWGPPK